MRLLNLLFIALVIFTCKHRSHAQTVYSLQQALRTARQHNPILKTEHFSILLMEADRVSASLRPNPTLNNQTLQQLNSRYYPENSTWNKAVNRQVWWQLTKPFQWAGQRKYRMEVADKTVSFAEINYLETERNLFADVANKWLDVWTVQKQLDILSIAKNNIDDLVKTNQNRLKNQVITQTDFFRTELLSKQYAIQYKTAQQELINKQRELQFAVGVQDSLTLDMADNFTFAISADVDSLIRQSLATRSDVLATKSLLDISASNIKLQKALAYPRPEAGFIWNPQNTVPYLGLYATINLPFFNRNQGEIKKSYAQQEQATQQLATLETKLRTEISNAYAMYRVQQQHIATFQSVLQQSETILENVKYAYLKGGTTIIDFLEAQRSWLDTQEQYYKALQQYRGSYIQLLYTTGLINLMAQ